MKLSSLVRTTHTKERDRADIRKYNGKEKRHRINVRKIEIFQKNRVSLFLKNILVTQSKI